MTTIDTNKATLTWSADGSTITKRPYGTWAPILPLFRNEQRVMRLLTIQPPPVRVPGLVATRRRDLVTEAIAGEPLGPKFPLALADQDIDEVVAMVERLATYRPRRRWFRRFDPEARLRAAVGAGVLGVDDADAMRRAVARHPMTVRFAHGDVTARNVLRDARTRELVLIDWEWSGWFPADYDRAFFWFSLVDVPGGRDRVARLHDPWFVLSATFVQLFHLWMWARRGTDDFIAVHRATRDELLERVRSLA